MTEEEITRKYHYDYNRGRMTSDADAVLGEHPTLGEMEMAFGTDFLKGTMHKHLLCAFQMHMDSVPVDMLENVEYQVVREFSNLKISEWVLYCNMVATGRIIPAYGRLNGVTAIKLLRDDFHVFRQSVMLRRLNDMKDLSCGDGEPITYEEYLSRKRAGLIDFESAAQYIAYSQAGVKELTDPNTGDNISQREFMEMKKKGSIDTREINKRIGFEWSERDGYPKTFDTRELTGCLKWE